MVKCLAQGHKGRDQPGRDSNPHSGNTRTPINNNHQHIDSFQLTWIQWILNAQHRGTIPLCHFLSGVFLWEVAPAGRHADPSLEVVEVDTIELKEFDELDT